MVRQRKKSKFSRDAWLNTYADMITLILVFFVLLYSMSTIDQEKYRLLVKAFTADPKTLEQLRLEDSELTEGFLDGEEGIEGKDGDAIEEVEDLDDLYAYLQNYVEENNLQQSVQVEKGDDSVYVRFMSTLFFEPDKAVLKAGGMNILSVVGNALSGIEDQVAIIRIDGHTAEADRGESRGVDDRKLSTDRANAVLAYLEGNHIKNPSKLMAVGYGMHRPVAPNDSEDNRAKNRRVEILISKEDALQQQLDKIYTLNE